MISIPESNMISIPESNIGVEFVRKDFRSTHPGPESSHGRKYIQVGCRLGHLEGNFRIIWGSLGHLFVVPTGGPRDHEK